MIIEVERVDKNGCYIKIKYEIIRVLNNDSKSMIIVKRDKDSNIFSQQLRVKKEKVDRD